MFKQTSNSRYQLRGGLQSQKTKRRLILNALLLLLITAAGLAGVSQLKVVRQFFSRASGIPANIIVDTQAVIGPMPRPWRNLAQGGEDHAWRLQPLQAQVNALHPRYIRLDHIYDFYDIVGGSPGNLTFDFSKLDLVLDDIKAAGAKPYIALSYMPPVIAEGDIVSKPKNWADWQLTVQKTIEHISGKRGTDDVYYEVWNEPDLFGGWKYYGDKSYLDLYTYAARGAAAARGVKPFKIGGPATTALYKNWFDALAKHVIKNRLRFDFFSWHRYAMSVDAYGKDMAEASSWLENYPQLMATAELHITEWGHDSNNHPGYDGYLGAAHTVAGSINMIGIIDNAFVFEIQDGKGPENQARWGRWGLFTHSSAGAEAKPRYNALRMLDKIADQRLQTIGAGSWVRAVAARDEQGNTEVVLANYDANASHAENVPVTFRNIEPGDYQLTVEMINGQNVNKPISTSSAELRVNVYMNPNSVGFVELKRR
ncbi:MAG: GH39 family glycosyl hydrolase [Patescibacteria group bacterium]